MTLTKARVWPAGMPDAYKVAPVDRITLCEAMERHFWARVCEMTDENGEVPQPTYVPRPPLTVEDRDSGGHPASDVRH